MTFSAWRPCDNTILSTQNDALLTWDAQSGEILDKRKLKRNQIPYHYSPDGTKFVAFDGSLEQVWVFDSATLEPIRALQLPEKQIGVQALSWSPNGKLIGVLSHPHVPWTLWFCDPATGKVLCESKEKDPGRDVGGSFLAWSPDGTSLAVSGSGFESPVFILDARTGKTLRVFDALQPNERVSNLSWSPDHKTVAVGSTFGSIYFYSAKAGVVLRTLPGHAMGRVQALTWAPDGKVLIQDSGNFDFSYHWEAARGKALKVPQAGDCPTRSFDGKLAATATHEGGLYIWDVSTKPHKNLEVKPETARIAAPVVYGWSHDSKILLIGNNDGRLQLWNAREGKLLEPFIKLLPQISGVAMSPDGKTIAASAGSAHEISIRNANTGSEIGIFGGCGAVAWSPDGTKLGVARDSQVDLRTRDGKQVLRTIDTHQISHHHSKLCSLAWSPDSKTLATGHVVEGKVQVWEAATGELLATLLLLGPDSAVAISPEGHYRRTPEIRNDRELCYVVTTDKGSELMSRGQFETKYGWKNNPDKVRLTAK
jgi:WD40 repeat protein